MIEIVNRKREVKNEKCSCKFHVFTVAQWVSACASQQKGSVFKSRIGQSLSVWSLHVLSVSA